MYLFFNHFILALSIIAFQAAQATGGDSYLIQTAIANGGIGAILFVMWFITFKYTQKQFQFALKQNQDQFDKALMQIEKQHIDNLTEQRRINDRLFLVIEKDAEYKEILTGVLTEMKNGLKQDKEILTSVLTEIKNQFKRSNPNA